MKTIKKIMLAGLLAVAALAPKETMADCWFLPALVEVQKVILNAHGRFLAAVKLLQTTEFLRDFAPATDGAEKGPYFSKCRNEASYGKNEDLKPVVTVCEGCSNKCKTFLDFDKLMNNKSYRWSRPETTDSLIKENDALLKKLYEKKKQ